MTGTKIPNTRNPTEHTGLFFLKLSYSRYDNLKNVLDKVCSRIDLNISLVLKYAESYWMQSAVQTVN